MIDGSIGSTNLLSQLRPQDLLSQENQEVDANGKILTAEAVKLYFTRLKENIDEILRKQAHAPGVVPLPEELPSEEPAIEILSGPTVPSYIPKGPPALKVVPTVSPKEEIKPPSHKLGIDLRKNLEKVAAKDFVPSFKKKSGKDENYKLTFNDLMEHTKQRTERLSEKIEEYGKDEYNKKILTDAEDRAKTDEKKKEKIEKQNITPKEYGERIQARLAVYKDWKFVPAKPEDADGSANLERFFLEYKDPENKKPPQKITVIHNKLNDSYTIKSSIHASDEAISIMIELSNSVLRFSGHNNMVIKGVEQREDLANKFKEGLDIINQHRTDPKEQIKYRINRDKGYKGDK